MRVLTIANQKGGSGKTTTAVNLAAALGRRERRVLVIDLDPQHSATDWFNIPLGNGDKGIYSVFGDNDGIGDILFESDMPNVDVVPSSEWLIQTERVLADQKGAENILKLELQKLPDSIWDYVLIDSPPNLGILTLNGLIAAREVMITVEAHVMALSGLAQLERTVQWVQEKKNPDLVISGVLACRVDYRTNHAQDVIESLRERFGDRVYRSVIRENIRTAESYSFHQPVNEYAPNSHGTFDYRELADEVIQQEDRYA